MLNFVRSLAFYGLMGCFSIHIASAQWLGGGPLPPNNSEIKSIAKRSDGRLLAGSKSGGVFISNDEITKWETQALGLTAGDGRDAKSIVILPDDTVLVGTKNGVFRSVDGGENFTRTSGLDDSRETLDARYLYLDPVKPNLIHLATKGGYAFSTDGGLTWQINNTGLNTPDEFDTKVIAVIPDPYTVFVGTQNGLFQTNDSVAGAWELTAPGVIDETEFKVLVVNVDASSLYLFAKSKGQISLPEGVYRSDDAGQSFIPIPLPSQEEVKEHGFAPSFTDPNEIISSDKQGNVFQSFDRGVTWELIPMPELNEEIKAFVRDTDELEQKWYIGSKVGFFMTSDAGNSFQAVNEGLVSPAAEGTHIIVDPNNPQKVFVGTKTGLWVSETGAETLGEGWLELTQEISTLFNLDIRRMLIDYANDPSGNTIYIAAKFDLFKYSLVDGDRLWLDSSNGIPPAAGERDKDIKWIVQDPDDPSILYASRKNTGGQEDVGEVFRSTDGGANWVMINRPDQFVGDGIGDPKTITLIGDDIFITTKRGVYKGSKNDPLPIDFESISDGLVPNDKGEMDIKQTAVSPDGDLYGSSKTGVFYLPNGSNTWVDITGDLPSDKEGERPETESIHWDALGRLWVGSENVGLFFMKNPPNGIWEQLEHRLPEGKSREIKNITTTPSNPNRIYAGTKKGTFVIEIEPETSISQWRIFE